MCRPVRQDWAWPVRQDWFLTCVPVGDHTTSDSLTGNCLLSNRMVWPMWVNIVNLQRQMRIKLQNEDDLRNMTMFYSRVRVRVRTVATLCLCTCVSVLPNNWAEQCVCTNMCLHMLQLGEGKCVRTVYHTTKQRPKTIQSSSENITRFYSRVRVRGRTVATPRFCTCAS